jgi:SPP1 gp7 family putative phage head morphogenesis protein
LSADFQRIENLLSDGIFAAYLLGYDEAHEENQSKLKANFADDDNRAEKAGPIDLRFDVKPEEAIDYFRRKRIVTQKTFNKLEREAKAASFYVSGVYREDVLTAFKDEITDALEDGQTPKYVTKQFKEILGGAGHRELGDWHLETTIRSNMMSAYGVGRRKGMEESADLLPFWEYSAVNDDRTRLTHRALDGLIYPANHEFWNTHYPPWGFNCRCTVIARLDMPEDYNHKKPNPDTTLAFDKDGLPAKAEYLTQVVDLKATKFVGVPKTADLEKALVDAAKAAKDSRLLNHQNVPQVIVDKAKEIRRAKEETIAGWDKDGEFVGQFKGDKDEVYYPPDIEPKLDGGFDIHNHPPENGQYFEAPSEDDFVSMVELKMNVRYVVTRNYLYQIRAPKNGWTADAIDDFYKSYEKHRAELAAKLNTLSSLNLTREQIDDIERHLIWKQVAKDLNFKYKRFKVSEL